MNKIVIIIVLVILLFSCTKFKTYEPYKEVKIDNKGKIRIEYKVIVTECCDHSRKEHYPGCEVLETYYTDLYIYKLTKNQFYDTVVHMDSVFLSKINNMNYVDSVMKDLSKFK